MCYCNVCMDPEAERLLRTTPLREIPSKWLAEYTNSAHGYDSGRIADDLRYFLPRYFELLADADPPHHYSYVLALARLGESSYRREWPREESEAIDAFFDALFVQQIADPSMCVDPIEEKPDPNGLLEFFATSGGDVPRLLRLWDAETGACATIRLAQFVDDVAARIARPRPLLGWGKFPGNEEHAVERSAIAWLKRPEVRERLERGFFAATNADERELLSRAETLLR